MLVMRHIGLICFFCPQFLFEVFGVRDFLPSDDIIHWLATYVCKPSDLKELCSNIIFIICGFDKPQLNMVSSLVILNYNMVQDRVKKSNKYRNERIMTIL